MKSYISVLFLLAFLFPSVIKEIHTTHHEEKINCDANAQHHFHELHQDCALCDVVLPITSTPSKGNVNFSSIHFAEYIFPVLIQNNLSSFHFFSSQLRAPPTLS